MKVVPKPNINAGSKISSSSASPAKASPPSTVQFVPVPNKPDHYIMTHKNSMIFELKKASKHTAEGVSYKIKIYLLSKNEKGNITSLKQYVPKFSKQQKETIERMRTAMGETVCESREMQEREEEHEEAEGEEEEVREEPRTQHRERTH
ncbi:hypothetical protein MMC08_009174 [Hypocenomyce scalaris]|nr:hypothetical protein [Hypocenomyce scalaris]